MSDVQIELHFPDGLDPAKVARSVVAQMKGPMARNSDPITSHEAAEDAKKNAHTLRARCLAAIKATGTRGLTDFELADIVGAQQTSAGKRRGELVDAGLVEVARDADGAKVKRPAPSGSNALVWVYKWR